MKKISVLLAFLLIFVFVFSSAYAHPSFIGNTNKKIIVFDEKITTTSQKEAIINNSDGVVVGHLKIINAVVAYLPDVAIEKLLKDENIIRVENDEIITMDVKPIKTPKPTEEPLLEVLPWGIDRVEADLAWSIIGSSTIKVAVLDTGIDLDHPDLIGNVINGYNVILPRKTANDDNGHGTHVAGIIAAVDNEFGVVGIGPNLEVYAVKVLDRRGSGSTSTVIAGIEWAIDNDMDVINMSLGGGGTLSLHEAVIKAYNEGIVLVSSAGNSYGGAVGYPAAYPEVIAVSSTNINNELSLFSSVGDEVDIAAPGEAIYSTYKNGKYATLSGTSMASPHVAGAVALIIGDMIDANPNAIISPDEVLTRLKTTALDLGDEFEDPNFGAGLLNVFKALSGY